MYVEREEAERIDRVASVVFDKESEDNANVLSIRRIDVTQSQGHESDKLEVIQHTIDKKDVAPAKQLYRRTLLIYSNVAVNAEEVIKKKYVCQKRTLPWVSRLVRVRKKFIRSGDYRTLSLTYSANVPRHCSSHDVDVSKPTNKSGLISQLMLYVNFECYCDPGCYGQVQTTESMQCKPLQARVLRRYTRPRYWMIYSTRDVGSNRGIRRSTPHRMSYGPLYQSHQTIHPTQDVVWAIQPEASDDPLHTGCRTNRSTKDIGHLCLVLEIICKNSKTCLLW